MIAFGSTQAGRVLDGNTYSFTCGTGVSMYMVTQDNVTAVTYAGVSLTLLRSFTPSIVDGNQVTVLLWSLETPASGINNFVFTCGVNPSVYSVSTYSGNIYTPENYNDEWSHTTSPAVNTQVSTFTSTITTGTDNSWSVVFICGGNNATRTFTGGAGTTARGTSGNLDTISVGILDSNAAITPAGSTSLISDWSSGSGFVSTITIALAPRANFLAQTLII